MLPKIEKLNKRMRCILKTKKIEQQDIEKQRKKELEDLKKIRKRM
jgi:hypothetical protein